MTQTSLILLLLKIGCLTGFITLTAWVAQYHVYTRGEWRHNELGRTFVVKSSLVALLLVPTGLSLFFHFTPLTSRVAGWADVILIGAITPVMCWRIAVWHKIRVSGVPPAQQRIAELELENARLRERVAVLENGLTGRGED